MLALLTAIVKARLNVLISGGTGAGKTTLLNILSSFIPVTERIVTIEDSAELQLKQPHVVRLETRPANIEGQGEVPQRLLLINALRMRPDRIIMGECRGSEAIDMLQAMNTGHDGSLTTLHANTPRDALSRLETMISMANLELPERAMRQQIASAINLVVQVSRLSDGSRKLMQVSEIVGMEGDIITMQDIFVYEREGMGDNDKVLGHFTSHWNPTALLRPAQELRHRPFRPCSPIHQHRRMAAEGYRGGRPSRQRLAPGAHRLSGRRPGHHFPGLSLGMVSGKSAQARHGGSSPVACQRANRWHRSGFQCLPLDRHAVPLAAPDRRASSPAAGPGVPASAG